MRNAVRKRASPCGASASQNRRGRKRNPADKYVNKCPPARPVALYLLLRFGPISRVGGILKVVREMKLPGFGMSPGPADKICGICFTVDSRCPLPPSPDPPFVLNAVSTLRVPKGGIFRGIPRAGYCEEASGIRDDAASRRAVGAERVKANRPNRVVEPPHGIMRRRIRRAGVIN